MRCRRTLAHVRIVVVLLAAWLFPAAGPATGAPRGADPVTLTFAATESEWPSFAPLISVFQADNPDISVNLVDLDALITPVIDASGNETWDAHHSMREILSAVDTAAVIPSAEAIEAGYVRDLASFIAADSTFDRSDFYPGVLEAFSRDGRTYVIPQAIWVPLLFYNKDLWAARGLSDPAPDWTWADLAEAAGRLALKRGDSVQTYGFLDGGNGYQALLSSLAASGVHLDPPRPQRVDGDPQLAAALDQIAGMAQTGAIYVNPEGFADFATLQQLVLDQQAGIWSPVLFEASSEGPPPVFGFQIGTTLFPSAPIRADGYIMSSTTQHPDAAWRWLAFLSRQPLPRAPDDLSARRQVPARVSIAERSGYWDQLDPQATAAVQTVLRQIAEGTRIGINRRVFGAVLFRSTLSAVVRGDITSSQALSAAQASLDGSNRQLWIIALSIAILAGLSILGYFGAMRRRSAHS